MQKIEHKVGDTVTIEVTIDNLSDNYEDAKLTLYRYNKSTGLTGEIKSLIPSDKVDNKFTFMYNTDDFMSKPMTYYGHFYIDNDGLIMNNYYKIRARY